MNTFFPADSSIHNTSIQSGISLRPGHQNVITALFHDVEHADQAYQFITNLGYDKDDIDVIMSESVQKKYFLDKSPVKNEITEKAGEGAAIGGTIAAIAAALSAIGTSLIIPTLGLVVAGPIAAGLAGAGAGSIAGGLIGALVGWGLPDERVKMYEDAINSGGILMGVKPRNEEDAQRIYMHLKSLKGDQIHIE